MLSDSFNTSLRKLQLNDPTFTSFVLEAQDVMYDGIYLVEAALTTNNTLTHLSIEENNIGDPSMQSIANILKSHSSLTYLQICHNYISSLGVQAIADALSINATLKHLQLENNRMGDIGACIIASSLKANCSITHLEICENNISDIGMRKIAKALQHNTALKHLELRGNNIGDPGAEYIATALRTNSTLSSLNMYDNVINKAGIANIAEALMLNCSLVSLDVDNNVIDYGSERILDDVIQKPSCNIIIACYDAISYKTQLTTMWRQDKAQLIVREWIAHQSKAPPSVLDILFLQQCQVHSNLYKFLLSEPRYGHNRADLADVFEKRNDMHWKSNVFHIARICRNTDDTIFQYRDIYTLIVSYITPLDIIAKHKERTLVEMCEDIAKECTGYISRFFNI